MACDSFAPVEALDSLPCDAYVQLLLHQIVRHRVEVFVDLNVIVHMYPRLLPFSELITFIGERFQG